MLFEMERTGEVQGAVSAMASANEGDRGAVFTKEPVVEAILDIAGYTVGEDLASRRILEPSFGDGDFLVPTVLRLLKSWRTRGGTPANAVADLSESVRAVELSKKSVATTAKKLRAVLAAESINSDDANTLVGGWLRQDDFLLSERLGTFDFVVGNPPYVRQEKIADVLMTEYRRRFSTIYDRADLYVPFFEKGLLALREGGVLAFICANRWTKNKYGRKLRALVANGGFALRAHIDLEDAAAFKSEVSAYPGIFVIEKSGAEDTRVARVTEVENGALRSVVEGVSLGGRSKATPDVVTLRGVVSGDEPWLLDPDAGLVAVREMERAWPTVEQDGGKVGIGVATGADAVFIGDYEEIPVENERKLPLVMAPDLVDGKIAWRGKGIANPFVQGGGLVDLDVFPRFGAFMRLHQERLCRRHVAKKNKSAWYRTIDRIHENLVKEEKLLIPDIKGHADVVYDEGKFYPHHNLYWITSSRWDLRALRSVLRSSIALLFVSAYAVRMRGGYLRFQAQYLRRIRVPRFEELDAGTVASLQEVGESARRDEIDRIVLPLYRLSKEAERAVRRFAETEGASDAQRKPSSP